MKSGRISYKSIKSNPLLLIEMDRETRRVRNIWFTISEASKHYGLLTKPVVPYSSNEVSTQYGFLWKWMRYEDIPKRLRRFIRNDYHEYWIYQIGDRIKYTLKWDLGNPEVLKTLTAYYEALSNFAGKPVETITVIEKVVGTGELYERLQTITPTQTVKHIGKKMMPDDNSPSDSHWDLYCPTCEKVFKYKRTKETHRCKGRPSEARQQGAFSI